MRKGLFAVIMFFSIHVAAQHPLVGTWEMVSIKGIDADGKKFSVDTMSVREIKIITPTHYMLIAHDVVADSLVFNRSYAGKITFDGKKFNEVPLHASVPNIRWCQDRFYLESRRGHLHAIRIDHEAGRKNNYAGSFKIPTR